MTRGEIMENLARNPTCDMFIERELRDAGIRLVRGNRQEGEVPATISGALGAFTFTRAWYYWIVEGKMPLDVAKELYEDPVGKTDVRVAGHGGCPPPEDPWIRWEDSKEREIYPLSSKPKNYPESEPGYEAFFEDPSKIGKGYITLYHIDTEEGLKLFAETIRQHQLF